MVIRSTSLANGTSREWILRIARRPFQSGRSTVTRRSKRPGRSNALSRPSGRFVAAITTTAWRVSKPSISTSNWFNVCSRSSLLLMLEPRWRPTASTSSMKMILGAAFLAWSKRSRTRLAPTPTSTSTNSEPLIEKNGTLASPATARASSVLPVPGGPTRSTPRGTLPPRRWNFPGVLRNSTTSIRSFLDSSTPATSAKVVLGLSSRITLARLLPKLKMFCWLCVARRAIKTKTAIISTHGNRLMSRFKKKLLSLTTFAW